MKSSKAQKMGRSGTGQASQHAKTAAVQAIDSDDDFDDYLPTPAVAAGSNAYELLLRGLDRLPQEPVLNTTSKAPKVKTRPPSNIAAPQGRAADSTPAEQPLHVSDDASSSDDDADDRSGGAMEEPADTAELADQGIADFYSNHFDSSSGGPTDCGKASSRLIEASQSRSVWPGTAWLTSGQTFPQVCQQICALCVLASAGNDTHHSHYSHVNAFLYSLPLMMCISLQSHICSAQTNT